MAEAAENAVQWASWQAAIAFFGTLFLVLNLGYAHKSAVAAGASAQAAARAAEIAYESLVLSNRPRLLMEIASIKLDLHKRCLDVDYKFVNYSSVPAILRYVQVDLIETLATPDSLMPPDQYPLIYHVVPPLGTYGQFKISLRRDDDTFWDDKSVTRAVLNAHFRYSDTFDIIYRDWICLRCVRGATAFKEEGGASHNYSQTKRPDHYEFIPVADSRLQRWWRFMRSLVVPKG